jgi:outer membrane murein-binding lipoprotein Lpp
MDKVSGSPEPTPNLFWRVDLMTMIRTTGLTFGAMTLAFTGIAGAADNDNASIDALRAELNELRAQNNSLAARVDAQDSEWLNEERASDIRGIVQDVLADSQSRTSLQDSGMMAGYKAGKGFFLSNQDGSFSLMVNGELQTRWVLNNNPGNQGATEETSWGFQVRRAKVRFQGNVIDPTWTYQINGSFEGPDSYGDRPFSRSQQFQSPGLGGPSGSFRVDGTAGVGTPSNGGTFEFQEAFIAKELDNGITLTFGQFKTPWMREELVESGMQLAVERSLINELFNQDRAVGIMVDWQNDD